MRRRARYHRSGSRGSRGVLRRVHPAVAERLRRSLTAAEEEGKEISRIGKVHLARIVRIGRVETRRRGAAEKEEAEDADGVGHVGGRVVVDVAASKRRAQDPSRREGNEREEYGCDGDRDELASHGTSWFSLGRGGIVPPHTKQARGRITRVENWGMTTDGGAIYQFRLMPSGLGPLIWRCSCGSLVVHASKMSLWCGDTIKEADS